MDDKKIDAVDALSRVSGLSRGTVTELWPMVKKNHKALTECSLHDFEEINGVRPTDTMYRCRKCGGEITAQQHLWYRRGVDDGKRADQQSGQEPQGG